MRAASKRISGDLFFVRCSQSTHTRGLHVASALRWSVPRTCSGSAFRPRVQLLRSSLCTAATGPKRNKDDEDEHDPVLSQVGRAKKLWLAFSQHKGVRSTLSLGKTVTWPIWGPVVYFFPFKPQIVRLVQFARELGDGMWDGSKRLYANTKRARTLKASRRLGNSLSRRDTRFLQQNSRDLRSMIPFFIVWRVPIIGDFLLPVFIHRFPHLLPSTFNLLNARKGILARVKMARLKQLGVLARAGLELGDTMPAYGVTQTPSGHTADQRDSILEEDHSHSPDLPSSTPRHTRLSLWRWWQKLRSRRAAAAPDEHRTIDPDTTALLRKTLEKDMPTLSARRTLFYENLLLATDSSGRLQFGADTLPFAQMSSLCAILDISTRAPAWILHRRFKDRLETILRDDQMLRREGIDDFTNDELAEACFERGLLVLGLSRNALRHELLEWLKIGDVNPVLLETLLVYFHAYNQRDLYLAPVQKRQKGHVTPKDS